MQLSHLRHIFLLVLGVLACSTAVILIKHSEMHALWLSASRLLVSALFLTPLWLRERSAAKAAGVAILTFRQTSPWPGIFLAAHFITWILGARLTPAANSTLIVNLVPLVSPFLLLVLVGEKVNAREILGTLIALAGILFMVWDDFGMETSHVKGDVLCFVSMILLAIYLVLGRRYRARSGLWTYMVPLYALAGGICLIVALAVEPHLPVMTPKETVTLLALVIVPTIIGHSLLNVSMRHLRGQIVTTTNTAQCLFAGVMAYFLFAEVPGLGFYVAAVAVVVAITLTLSAKRV